MAIVKCGCGKNYSDRLPACPFCDARQTPTAAAGGSGEDTMACPFCAEPIQKRAVLCKHCNSRLPGALAGQQAVWSGAGVVLHALPWVGSMLLFFWVGNSPLIQANGNLSLVAVAVVLGSAIAIAVESARVGMGSIPNPKTNKKEEGPVAWFFSALLLWLIAYPLYMFRRAHYGLAGSAWPCLAGTLVFVLLAFQIGMFVDAELTRIQLQGQRIEQQAQLEYDRAMKELEKLSSQNH